MNVNIFTLCVLALSYDSLAASDYPGTNTRPILSEKEASVYDISSYFAGWEPEEIEIPDQPDYVVQEGQSIQTVVNEAIRNGTSGVRTYIKIEPGHYMETVYIKSDVPLTIYGGSDNSEDIHIMATLSANTLVSDYINIVNEDGKRYQEGDPAWDLYQSCAKKEGTLRTGCTAVFWVESDNFQLYGVTIHNGGTDAQAIALRTEADQLHLMNSNFLGYQDTVALGIGDVDGQRVLIHMSYIEGEMDYVYGAATAVFNMVTFNSVAIKDKDTLIVFAPDTPPDQPYGFLVINSNITGDASYLGSSKVRLARSWDRGVSSADLYVPGESRNGQLVIRDTNIDKVINVESPYSDATSKRPFTTDISTERVLDDNTHNRFWEYNNSGDGI